MRVLISLLAVGLLAGCGGEPPATPATPEVPAAPPTAPTPEVALPRVPAKTETRFAARHILIAYNGALNALPNLTRSRDEARARAEEVRQKLQAGQDFAALAKAYSDDATGPRGGDLGGFDQGTMVAPFEEALKALPIGGVSGIVETPFGFHILQREPLAEIHAAHALVSYAGAERMPAGVTRSKEEARARAEALLQEVQGGLEWRQAVRKYSDGPMKEEDGDLGWFGRGQLAPQLDEAAFALDIGQVSGIIESPRGFHVLKRIE